MIRILTTLTYHMIMPMSTSGLSLPVEGFQSFVRRIAKGGYS